MNDEKERERQDDLLILIRRAMNAAATEERELITHLNRHRDEVPHFMDECPSYQAAKTHTANLFDELQRRLRCEWVTA